MGLRWVCAVLLALTATAPAGAQSPGQSLSEKSLNSLMEQTWKRMPERCAVGRTKSFRIDKAGKSATSIVPPEAVRAVVDAAQRSSHALACGLDELAAENYCSFLGRQIAARTWSDQQLAFLGMLFHRTSLIMSGRILLRATLDEKTIGRANPERKASCRDDMHARVSAGIRKYVAEAAAPTG